MPLLGLALGLCWAEKEASLLPPPLERGATWGTGGGAA